MKPSKFRSLLRWLAVVSALVGWLPAGATPLTGRVLDNTNQRAIAGAVVTVGSTAAITDSDGKFAIDLPAAEPTSRIGARAAGYRAVWIAPAAGAGTTDISLPPFQAKALYLSMFGIGDRGLRHAALDLIQRTELNALVIDVKGDRGLVPYRSGVALTAQIGAQGTITVRDMPALLADLKAKGIYLIARIVAFKDDKFAPAHPALAIKDHEGGLWRDREGLAWADPAQTAIWDYNIALAKEAARIGFDEVMFDYVRFPDGGSPVFSQPNTQEMRVGAINGFLRRAHQALVPDNVFLSAAIFGYVCWNTNDTVIGQHLESLAPHVDYLAPMLYPSGFQYGIPGVRDPVADSHAIVLRSLQNAVKRTRLPAARFRPWLQSFKDYAFDRRVFGAEEIRQQIDAARESGASGWLLWNPRNAYGADGLRSESAVP